MNGMIGNSKTYSLPLLAIGAALLIGVGVVVLALFAPEGRWQEAVAALTKLATWILGAGGVGGVTLGARDAFTKGMTSSNVDHVRAVELARAGQGSPSSRASTTRPGQPAPAAPPPPPAAPPPPTLDPAVLAKLAELGWSPPPEGS